MSEKLKKIGENENIILYVDESLENQTSDGMIVHDKKTGIRCYSNPMEKRYGKDIREILNNLPDEEESEAMDIMGIRN